jgi:hypothetical protein|tara:strand:- start:31 stop:186 length:156 start_codon:yes stop_codon:yes gene_type:complete
MQQISATKAIQFVFDHRMHDENVVLVFKDTAIAAVAFSSMPMSCGNSTVSL